MSFVCSSNTCFIVTAIGYRLTAVRDSHLRVKKKEHDSENLFLFSILYFVFIVINTSQILGEYLRHKITINI